MSYFKKKKLQNIIGKSITKLEETNEQIKRLNEIEYKKYNEKIIRSELYVILTNITLSINPICNKLTEMGKHTVVIFPDYSPRVIAKRTELFKVKDRLERIKTTCDKYIIDLIKYSDVDDLVAQTTTTVQKLNDSIILSERNFFDKYDENATDNVEDESKAPPNEA